MFLLSSIAHSAYGHTLFSSLSCSLDGKSRGRIALLGRNGAGKSTLLRIIAGLDAPDAGTVRCEGERVAYLPQEIVFPDTAGTVGDYLEQLLPEPWMTYLADIALQEVGLPDDISEQPVGTLSGGQRVRVALAGLLLQEPTVLLLDEPTNHLDAETTAWLQAWLRSYPGTVVMATHDRELIDAVADELWEITPEGMLDSYRGSFAEYMAVRTARQIQRLAEWEMRQRSIDELQRWLAANAMHPKYRFSSIVSSKQRTLEHELAAHTPRPIADPEVRLPALPPAPQGRLLHLRVDAKHYSERVVLQDVSLSIHGAQRVWITGGNGAGKSTLLRIAAGLDTDYAGTRTLQDGLRVAYVGQHVDLPPRSSVLQAFLQAAPLASEQEARSVLHSFLFGAADVGKACGMLSPGQQRRLQLAVALAQRPRVLLLDEPTNHLDVFLCAQLADYLAVQPVAVCVVTHQVWFARAIGAGEGRVEL